MPTCALRGYFQFYAASISELLWNTFYLKIKSEVHELLGLLPLKKKEKRIA